LEWRSTRNKAGDSWTLWFRPYKLVDRKKKWLKSDYVFYISAQQWERLKTYDRERQRNYIEAEFGHWWQTAKTPRAARASA
jgi:hypothetical protein